MARVLAVDLGASSARVCAVDLTTFELTELHRHPHGPVRAADGTLRWDWDGLVAAVETGLRAGLEAGPVASIGIDTWAVDYGLLDRDGRLLSAPYSYRDDRTAGWREVVDRIGAERLYATTGIQLMAINTIFQLASHDRRELEAAAQLSMLAELLVAHLTGERHGERTTAGSTSLVDLATGSWSEELITAIDVDPALFPAVERAPAPAGVWEGVPVHLVGGHDTASAYAAVPGPPAPGAAIVSSGTWMLVGAEREAPDTSPAAAAANFSNEPGVFDDTRFLKNVMGLWMVEECRRAWGGPPVEELVHAATAVPAGGPVVDATDGRFLAPLDMEAEVRAAAALPSTAGRDVVIRCVLDSLAVAAAGVVDELGTFLGAPVPEVHVVGGGVRNELLNRLLEDACGVPVRRGPVEATALGNAIVQGIGLGVFDDLPSARARLAAVLAG